MAAPAVIPQRAQICDAQPGQPWPSPRAGHHIGEVSQRLRRDLPLATFCMWRGIKPYREEVERLSFLEKAIS